MQEEGSVGVYSRNAFTCLIKGIIFDLNIFNSHVYVKSYRLDARVKRNHIFLNGFICSITFQSTLIYVLNELVLTVGGELFASPDHFLGCVNLVHYKGNERCANKVKRGENCYTYHI
jgi:hypothetical protein